MTRVDLRPYQKRLLELKQHLGGVLSELEEAALRPLGGEASGKLSDLPLHPADMAAENSEEAVAIDLLANEKELLSEVNSALDRLEQRAFGRCEECGQDISRERLKALPYARYCVRCARQRQGEHVASAHV